MKVRLYRNRFTDIYQRKCERHPNTIRRKAYPNVSNGFQRILLDHGAEKKVDLISLCFEEKKSLPEVLHFKAMDAIQTIYAHRRNATKRKCLPFQMIFPSKRLTKKKETFCNCINSISENRQNIQKQSLDHLRPDSETAFQTRKTNCLQRNHRQKSIHKL